MEGSWPVVIAIGLGTVLQVRQLESIGLLTDVRHFINTLSEVLLNVFIITSLLLIKIGLLNLFLEVNLIFVLLLGFSISRFPPLFLLYLDSFVFSST
jgi:hypothetical protein